MYALEICQLQLKEEGGITNFILTTGFFRSRLITLCLWSTLKNEVRTHPSTEHNCYIHQSLCCKENIHHMGDASARKRNEICVCMCVCAYVPDYWFHIETHLSKVCCLL